MKKLLSLFAAIVFASALSPAFCDENTDAARAAAKRSAAPQSALTTQKTTSTRVQRPESNTPTQSVASRNQNIQTNRERATSPRDNAVVTDTGRSTSTQNVSARTATNVLQRNNVQTPKVSERATSARTATNQPVASRSGTVSQTPARTSLPTTSARSAAPAVKTARSATSTETIAAAANNVVDYKKCREVYYQCMDEFCANKNSQLKRCACSSRSRDFDNVKKQMSKVEDKILDFNERLLTVSMEKEDAEAIFKATEGEQAFQQDDKSSSKKILDEISKKLRSNTADKDAERNLSAIVLSLDTDSAFDTVDSMMGASTTSKEGLELYGAAIPICREMVAEICDESAVSIVENGYKMAIEQDCNTVDKAYQVMRDQALNKAREGSALLDMSRLDIYQKRNSDDILACKKKMLDALTDTSVCGEGLSKCLDTTGKYIDPSTGTAFLTVSLVNLGDLITRPDGDQKWTTMPGNESFVSFLNSKKKYLEPAMENCQDISDRVWNDFIEDALSQIKLAQGKKLEELRQNCTTLTTQCLSDTSKSITDFDARALSIFGVTADKTVNEMCSKVKTACTALLEKTSGDMDEWVGGMTEIATDKTFDTIMQTCREVGKACIIQTCKSISGNFGLCESVEKSVNRKSIINRSACWNEVVQCVADAGKDPITNIMSRLGKQPSTGDEPENHFYTELYGTEFVVVNYQSCDPKTRQSCVYDICYECGTPGKPDCATCRLAERIWGNCEFKENTDLKEEGDRNWIKQTKIGQDTLLSWFAENTGTAGLDNSCMDTTCGIGKTKLEENGFIICADSKQITDEKIWCTDEYDRIIVANSPEAWTNCCKTNKLDVFGNCCEGANSDLVEVNNFCATPGCLDGNFIANPADTNKAELCVKKSPQQQSVFLGFDNTGTETHYKTGMNFLVCMGGNITYDEVNANAGWPGGRAVKCSGNFVVVNRNTGSYFPPKYDGIGSGNLIYPYNYYKLGDGTTTTSCLADFNTTNTDIWGMLTGSSWTSAGGQCDKIPAGFPNSGNHLFIQY